MAGSEENRLPLKRPPQHGVYLRWPLDGDDWIHPEDVEAVKRVIPSRRIFRREDIDMEYAMISYGDLKLRVRPTMWLEVEYDGYWVGDQVEVRSQLGRRDHMIATIRDIHWDPDSGRIQYFLQSGQREPLHTPFDVEDLQPVHRLDRPMTWRERQLSSKSQVK
jgi:hypothetical protein